MFDHIKQQQKLQKSRIIESIGADSITDEDLQKSEIESLEKGYRGEPIGTQKTFGGRNYIKTTSGWKYHGKGTGAKAQEHSKGALEHHVSQKMNIQEKKSLKSGGTPDSKPSESKMIKINPTKLFTVAHLSDFKLPKSLLSYFEDQVDEEINVFKIDNLDNEITILKHSIKDEDDKSAISSMTKMIEHFQELKQFMIINKIQAVIKK